MESARTLVEKIAGALGKLNMRYQEEGYSLSVAGNQISVESVQGIAGLHLIKFQS
jgi:hypothetical protein